MSNLSTIPSSLPEFEERFPTETSCEEHLFRQRWPGGFECPRCGHDKATPLRWRRQYQCRGCKYQVSVTAGTALHRTKVSLKKWFWAIFLVARHKNGISALQLKKDLGLGSYGTAWLMLQKIRKCFGESDEFLLQGQIEVDETLVGAKGKGDAPGKDPGHKAIVVAAVALGERKSRGFRWHDVRAQHVQDYTGDTLRGFVKRYVQPGSTVIADGWQAYDKLTEDGYELERHVSSSMNRRQMRDQNPMPHIHLFFSNLKAWLTGCYHGVSHKYLAHYLNEFLYRLNRRRKPTNIFDWIQRRLVRGSPSTLRDLQLAGSTG